MQFALLVYESSESFATRKDEKTDCGPQKSRTLFQPKPQGSVRCPPTGIHPCNNALRNSRTPLI
jgi:hypothetical protein